MEPLAIANLAGLTPPEIDLSFYDDRLEPIPYDESFDLVGISVETYTARRAYQIAVRFRERGARAVLGGYHPTLMPDEAAAHADAVVVGDAEVTWPQLLTDAAAGQLKPMYRPAGPPALDTVRVDRSIFGPRKYLNIGLAEAARGCRYACDFCSISAFYRGTHRYRPPQEVAREIAGLSTDMVFLVDDNVGANRQALIELCKAMEPLRSRWFSQLSVDRADDEELVKWMAKSGCRGVLIGFESLDGSTLTKMNKCANRRHGIYESAIKKLRDHGIWVYGTFVFGYDNDRRSCFEQALEFSLQHRLYFAAFNHVVPFPGTPLYRRLQAEGRLLYDRWWLEPGVHFGDVVFRPTHMTPEELRETCFEYRQRFYCLRSVLTRCLDFQANCPTVKQALYFLAMSLFVRRDVRRRQGLPLGENL